MSGPHPFRLPDRVRTRQRYDQLRPAYEQVLQQLQHGVRELLERHELRPTIKGRVKRFIDYYEKLQRSARKNQGPPVITDLLGLRIVCPFLEDVEKVETLLAEHFEVTETVCKAAGHSFREFGYDSVHLLVRVDAPELAGDLPHTHRVCEIQLRTILQDAWAEVEHELVYKSRLSWPNESVRRKLAALNATLTLSDLTFQEIRDYQKSVRDLDRRRRSALDSALDEAGLSWPPALDAERHAAPEPLPVASGSPLEKGMLAALEAHGAHRFDRAVDLYTRALALHMDRKIRALLYNHRGMALFALGRTAEARRDFARAVEYDPENLRAHCNRGLLSRQQQRFARALEDYERALVLNPAFAEALLGRAQVYLEMKFPDRALADCEKALEFHPELSAAAALRDKIRRDFFMF